MMELIGTKTFWGGMITIAVGIFFLVSEKAESEVAMGFIVYGIQCINKRHTVVKNGKKN